MTNAVIDQSKVDTDQLTPEAELALALATKADQQQEVGSKDQVGEELKGTVPDPSRSDDGTTEPSRSDVGKSKEELLSSLTLDEIKSHPTLGPALKSYADQEAARQFKGKTVEIERRTEEKLNLERAKKHFESLSKEELAQELAEEPDAAELYGRIKSMPPPNSRPPDEVAVVQYYNRVIKDYDAKRVAANLPKEINDKLDPETFLLGKDGDSDTILAQWTSAVDEAIIASKVAAERAKFSKVDSQSKDLDSQAKKDEEEGDSKVLMEAGRKTRPILPIETRSDLLLQDAFERTATQQRK